MEPADGNPTKKILRPSWEEFWFTMALFYSTRGTCDRLKAACILVDKNNRLLGAGYNGSLPGDSHCDQVGHLMVDGHCIRTLHAEVNAIMHSIGDLEGATAYVLGTPCIDCVKKLLVKKVKKILFTKNYNNKARGGEYIFELAKNQAAEIKYVDINFPDILYNNVELLNGPGGALANQDVEAALVSSQSDTPLFNQETIFQKQQAAEDINTGLRVQKIDPDAKLPQFAYNGDAGMDIFSCEERRIESFGRAAIGTGLKIAVPKGCAGFIWDKSGLAIDHCLTTLAGVIDSGYRGELKVVLMNLGKAAYNVKKHQKIAQLIIKKVERPNIIEDILDDTQRNEKGFGSSGL